MKMTALVRSALALAAAIVIVAGAGSRPTIEAAAGGSLSGTAFFNPFATGGFPDAVEGGVPGRAVVLHGDIEGTNFEAGTCHPGVDSVFGLHCFLFGDGPGLFTRERAGGVAFTICHCTVGGVGDPDDTVVLKIGYPPSTPTPYPSGFTKFTFQDGTGALRGLSGQGTLDFGGFPQATFTYRFAGH